VNVRRDHWQFRFGEVGHVAVPRSAGAAGSDVRAFCEQHDGWIVERCYADLTRRALGYVPLLLFMDPGVDACLSNCLQRPWACHETISAAYVQLLAGYLDACPRELPPSEAVATLLESPLASKHATLTFYSRERLMSTTARAVWVEPDLAPIRANALGAEVCT
jgi:hypothetical protein